MNATDSPTQPRNALSLVRASQFLTQGGICGGKVAKELAGDVVEENEDRHHSLDSPTKNFQKHEVGIDKAFTRGGVNCTGRDAMTAEQGGARVTRDKPT